MQVKRESLNGFLRACDRAETDTRVEVRATLQRAADIVRGSAASRMAAKHAPSAAGYRSRVLGQTAWVQQSRRKTTRQHPEWGGWQMRNVLLPALYGSLDRVQREFGQATERVARRFETG